jgi:hypothetical protein
MGTVPQSEAEPEVKNNPPAVVAQILFTIAAIGVGVNACATKDQISEERVTIRYPSDLRARGKGTTPFRLDFLLHPMPDMRLMYCDEVVLRERVAAGVCVLDVNQAVPYRKEVHVLGGAKLIDVMEQSDIPLLKGWRGIGPPAVWIIKKHSILGHDGSFQFLQTEISAGDFIVVVRGD